MAYREQSASASPPKGFFVLIGVAILAVLSVIGGVVLLESKQIRGTQVGVKETWSDGVRDEVLVPKNYIYQDVTQHIYTYTVTPQTFVMNNKVQPEEQDSGGRQNDAYVTTSLDNQKITIEPIVQWRLDPSKVVAVHKYFGCHDDIKNWQNIVEEKSLRAVLIRAMNIAVSKQKAIDQYSGVGFTNLQRDIFTEISKEDGELARHGVIVDSFAIERITLSDEYIGEINKRQVAEQRELRAKQEEKAALAEAQKAKAEAQKDYEIAVVAAERSKQQTILQSEASAQERVNAARAKSEQVKFEAEAEANRIVIAAQAERTAAENRAAAITAIGTAEAESQRLKLAAYAVPGADAFVQIEISKNLGTAFSGIQGYLPQDMQVNLLSDNFMKSVQGLMGKAIVTHDSTPASK